MKDRGHGPASKRALSLLWRRAGVPIAAVVEGKIESAGHSPTEKLFQKQKLSPSLSLPLSLSSFNSPTFQRFAVRSNAMAQELAKKSTAERMVFDVATCFLEKKKRSLNAHLFFPQN